MALYHLLFASTIMIVFLCRGCHSQLPACGRAVRNTRIVGGQDAPPGSWPWHAGLLVDGDESCGGSLIHNQWALTAAHCISEDDLLKTTVLLGRQSFTGPNVNQVSRGLDLIICHPLYNFLTNDNDICLLKLSSPVNFTDYIQPVCLASAGSTFHTGVSSWVVGFGATEEDSLVQPEILQEVNVPIVGMNECRCTYPLLTDNMICAGLRAGGKDACQGDSGSALVTKVETVWVQSGIVSFGDGCARANTPGGYTRVSQYQEWITNITGSSTPGFVTFNSSGVDSDLNFNCTSLITTTTSITTTTTTAPTTTTTATTVTSTVTTTTTTPDPKEEGGDSVFDSSESMIHFCHFTSLCILVISLYVLVGDT